MSNEEVIAQILIDRGIDVKDVDARTIRKIMKDKEPQKPQKIRLAPLSFSKVLNLFIKATEIKIALKQNKLQSMKEEFSEEGYTLSEDDAKKIAKKMAKLESQINVLQYKQRMKKVRAERALKLKKQMFGCMQRQSGELYKFTKNPFEKDIQKENNNQQNVTSLADQLNQRLDSVKDNSNGESMVSLNDFAVKANTTDDENVNTTSISLEEQLNDKLAHVAEEKKAADSSVPMKDTSYNLEMDPEEFDKIRQKRKEEADRFTGSYRLKKDEIIQDSPVMSSVSSIDLSTSNNIEKLPSRGYHGIMAEKNERTNVSQEDQDYLNQTIISQNQAPSLEDERRMLEKEIDNRSHIVGDDYIRKDYQQQLDRVQELIERQAGLSTTSSIDTSDFSNANSIEELRDLMRLAEAEERKAQEVADQARLAKEEALQAAREKEESERMSTETNEKYEQLLQEAKSVLETRSQRARDRMQQEQAELDRNRNLTEGIRRDSEALRAKVAARQTEISQLENVLDQYKTDVPAVSKR